MTRAANRIDPVCGMSVDPTSPFHHPSDGQTHRDLKPENLFVTHDGRVKILDFGLAKTRAAPTDHSETSTPTRERGAGTEPGAVMGTVGYMLPEQVRGEPADPRSEMFAFGAILHEMLLGRRAFQRDTAAETMTAILKEEPGLSTRRRPRSGASSIVAWKRIQASGFNRPTTWRSSWTRFSRESGPVTVDVGAPRAKRSRVVVVAAVLLVGGAYWLGRILGDAGPAPFLNYERLTFRRGTIYTAQFDPASRDVIYSATWDGSDPQVYSTLPGTRESRALRLESADVASVSPHGEMALIRKPSGLVTWDQIDGTGGTLTLSTPSGGAAREIAMGDVLCVGRGARRIGRTRR